MGDGDGSVVIYDPATGEEEQGFRGLHGGAVLGLAFSDDGSRLASGGEDGSVFVIDAETGRSLASPPPSGSAISSVAWADDRLLTGGADGIVRIWSEGSLEGELGPHAGGVTSMALGPDGMLAVSDFGGQVTLWDLDAQERFGPPLAIDDNAVWDVAWSPDGSSIAAALDDGSVTRWDVESRAQVGGALTPQPGGAAAVAYLDDSTIVTTTREGVVRLWDAHEGVPLGIELGGTTSRRGTPWRSRIDGSRPARRTAPCASGTCSTSIARASGRPARSVSRPSARSWARARNRSPAATRPGFRRRRATAA